MLRLVISERFPNQLVISYFELFELFQTLKITASLELLELSVFDKRLNQFKMIYLSKFEIFEFMRSKVINFKVKISNSKNVLK